MSKETIAASFRDLQKSLCLSFEKVEHASRFGEDAWERKGGGGGLTRIMEGGTWIERGGVNFSAVHGEVTKTMRQLWKGQSQHFGRHFYATGVSVVMHPRHPYMPIIHMNVRYFELNDGSYWFGGGMDMTPHYVDEGEACAFHRALQKICDAYEEGCYARFKAWADDYFFLSHRGETRGIGGIFFDGLGNRQDTGARAGQGVDRKTASMEMSKKASDNMQSKAFKEKTLRFVLDLGYSLPRLYVPLIEKHKDRPYGPAERAWQCLRRGRYVEFNLIQDLGTRFGLETGGRTESILMSLPPQAQWHYKAPPPERSREHATLQWLKKGIDWVSAGAASRDVSDMASTSPFRTS